MSKSKKEREALAEQCNQDDHKACIDLGRIKALDAMERSTQIRTALLFVLGSFFLTFIIMMIVFRIEWGIFHFYMNIWWANEFGIELIPSLWGWILIAVLIVFAAISFYLLYSRKNEILTKVMLIITGVFLQLLLYGINTKFIW